MMSNLQRVCRTARTQNLSPAHRNSALPQAPQETQFEQEPAAAITPLLLSSASPVPQGWVMMVLVSTGGPLGWSSSRNTKPGLFSWSWWSFRNVGITAQEPVLPARPSASSSHSRLHLSTPGQYPVPAIPAGYSNVQQMFYIDSRR